MPSCCTTGSHRRLVRRLGLRKEGLDILGYDTCQVLVVPSKVATLSVIMGYWKDIEPEI